MTMIPVLQVRLIFHCRENTLLTIFKNKRYIFCTTVHCTVCTWRFDQQKIYTFIKYSLCYQFNLFIHFYCILWLYRQVLLTVASLPTLRPIFYCCNTFDRDSTMFAIKEELFTLTVWSTTTRCPHDCKNGPPYPSIPAWRHIVVRTFLSHGHKKMGGKNIHNYFIHRHSDPVYGLLNVP